mgnify:CR=1 FL=1
MELLIKDPDALKDRWGKRPSDRTVGELLSAGVVALDKPEGPTSHQVTAWARDAIKVIRIGHGGTLDPNVSGVLPLCLGKSVRLTDLVLSSDKEYVCAMSLHGDRPEEKIRAVTSTFVGRIYQTPPVRSSVKRQMRIRNVSSIDILEIDGRDMLFRVSCDAGTYIRTLCVDIGEALGCGAHMVQLRRTRSWLRSIVMPIEVLAEPLPKVIAKATAVDALCHGADLTVRGIHMLDEDIRRNALAAVMTARGELVAIGRMQMSTSKIMASDQGVAVKIERVIMDTGHYPRMWKYATDLEDEQPL